MNETAPELPPLRDVIRRHDLQAAPLARPELPARSQSYRSHRARRRAAGARPCRRDRPRAGRPHPRPPARRRAPCRRRSSATRAASPRSPRSPPHIPTASPSSPATRSRSIRRALRRAAAQDRRQPALQHRDAAAARLAPGAPGLREPDAHVPEGGGRAARRGAAQQGLWPPLGDDPVGRRGAQPLRHSAARFRAATQGDVERRPAGAARGAAGALPARGSRSASSPPPSASAARCCARA